VRRPRPAGQKGNEDEGFQGPATHATNLLKSGDLVLKSRADEQQSLFLVEVFAARAPFAPSVWNFCPRPVTKKVPLGEDKLQVLVVKCRCPRDGVSFPAKVANAEILTSACSSSLDPRHPVASCLIRYMILTTKFAVVRSTQRFEAGSRS
jgi:hypothetical protein